MEYTTSQEFVVVTWGQTVPRWKYVDLVGGSDVMDKKSSVRSVATTWRFKAFQDSVSKRKCARLPRNLVLPFLSNCNRVSNTFTIVKGPHDHPLSSSGWNNMESCSVALMICNGALLWCQYRKIPINQFLQEYGILVEDTILYLCITIPIVWCIQGWCSTYEQGEILDPNVHPNLHLFLDHGLNIIHHW